MRHIKIHCGLPGSRKHVSLLCISWCGNIEGRYCYSLHLGVWHWAYWYLGYKFEFEIWPIDNWGFGPLFLLTRY